MEEKNLETAAGLCCGGGTQGPWGPTQGTAVRLAAGRGSLEDGQTREKRRAGGQGRRLVYKSSRTYGGPGYQQPGTRGRCEELPRGGRRGAGGHRGARRAGQGPGQKEPSR